MQTPLDPQRPADPAVPPPTKSRTGPLLAGVGIGIVVVVVVGAVLLLTHVLAFHKSTTAAGPDATPVTLPAQLGNYADLDQVVAAKNPSAAAKAQQIKVHADTVRLTTAAYGQAFAGAAVGVRQYSDPDLMHMFGVIAVRATAPGPTLGLISDPADEGLAVNMQEIRTQGDVQCLVINQTAAAGQPVDDTALLVASCQKSGPALTVVVTGGQFKGTQALATMAGLVDQAYAAVSGTAP